MEPTTVTRMLRAIRRQKRWSQTALGQRLGISRSEMSRWERSSLAECSLAQADRWATALGARLQLELRVDGERPQTDARHARLQEWLMALLRSAGWSVEPEVSFNVYGDRGRIDVLAYHPMDRITLVVEVKTRLLDAQDVLGRLDVKRRVAPSLARERGWAAETTVPVLVLQESTTARRRLAAHRELFATLELRARAAVAWLRRPEGRRPKGVLLLVSPAR